MIFGSAVLWKGPPIKISAVWLVGGKDWRQWAKAFRLAFVGVRLRLAAGLPGGNGRKTAAFCFGVRVTPSAELSYDNVLRAPPCACKGHRPLTRFCAKLAFCFLGFGLRLTAKCLRQRFAGSSCTRKGQRPLTRDCAKLAFCFIEFGYALRRDCLAAIKRKPLVCCWGSEAAYAGCVTARIRGLRPAPARDSVP